MVATIIISCLTFIGVTLSILFFPKIKIRKMQFSTYWLIALIGAIVLLTSNLIPIEKIFNELTNNESINPLKIIVLFFSMTFISIYLDKAGLFKSLALKASSKAKNKQLSLFLIFYVLISILTVFTSNDIVILTFTPFIIFFAKNAKINPIPYLVAEFASANTWSLMLIIGNPTNIYLATRAGIDFFSYFKIMVLPTLCGGTLQLLLLLLLFYKKLKEPFVVDVKQATIKNKLAISVGLIHLFVCLVFLIISNYINMQMWLIAAISATSLIIIAIIHSLINKSNFVTLKDSLISLPYPLIPFFISMCIIVIGFHHYEITNQIASFLNNGEPIWMYGISSYLVSNLINNIPMAILYSNIASTPSAVYASIVGSNIGAFLTPIGALAGIMFTSLVNSHQVKYSFLDFMKYGLISLPILAITLLVLSFTINF